jgi:hypothetical protein
MNGWHLHLLLRDMSLDVQLICIYSLIIAVVENVQWAGSRINQAKTECHAMF